MHNSKYTVTLLCGLRYNRYNLSLQMDVCFSNEFTFYFLHILFNVLSYKPGLQEIQINSQNCIRIT